MKKNFFLWAFVLVLLSTAVFGGFVRPAVAEETIYIRADGSIEGTTAISTVDNITYTFTDNINDMIYVERSNIIIDGAGYTLQAIGIMSFGFSLSQVNNVTIKNTNIKDFAFTGIVLAESSSNNIIANNITANEMDGIALGPSSNNNNISGNTITNNGNVGIRLEGASSNNIITANNVANNDDGIVLAGSSNNNSIIANNMTANDNDGIRLEGSSNNTIYHNNIIDNGIQVNIVVDGSSDWDDGAKGNYWSDYESRYPNATEVDGSGIWDTPYVIDGSNQDNYPIIPEFPTWTLTLLLFILLTVVTATYKCRLLKTPNH
jgi:parallel beta-helix repeat protein